MRKVPSLHLPKQGIIIKKPLALAIHLLVTAAASAGVYFLASSYVSQQQQQQLNQFAKQASTLITQHANQWQQQAQLLAQQPGLKSAASLKAVIPPDGTVPPSLNYADQDLLNRTRSKATSPEISGNGDKATVSTALAMPAGGYALFEWSAKPLITNLTAITPENIELKFSQEVSGSEPVEVLRLHSRGNDGALRNIPLTSPGWRLAVQQNATSSLPFWAALLSLISGLLILILWTIRKSTGTVGLQSVNDVKNNTQNQDKLAGLISISNTAGIHTTDTPPSTVPHSNYALPEPAGLADSTESSADSAQIKPADNIQDSAALEAIAPIFTLDKPEPAPEKEVSLLEFNLDGALLPDLNLNATASQLPQHLFRAYDIRGSVDVLTTQLISQIGRALGTQLREQNQYQVAVGYDARTSSPGYARLIHQALSDSGLTVIDIGMVTSPLLYFAAQQHDGNGIMITASHNPASDNGIKWLMQQRSPTPDDVQAIFKRIQDDDFIEGMGTVRRHSYNEEYLDLLQHDVILSQPVSISIDAMNGSAGQLALAAFQNAGCLVSSLNTDADGAFPNGAPDPGNPENLQELGNDIVISGNQIGFAFDGDGDRLVVLDNQGHAISPDHLIILFAKMCLDSNPGSDIIIDVKCSRIISSMVTSAGGRAVMVRTGNTFLRAALNDPEYQAVFAGEFSGHYFFNDLRGHGQDDGIYAALRLLEWLDNTGQTLEEALADLPVHVGTKDIYLPLEGQDAKSILEHFESDASQLMDAKITTIDGVRLDFNTGFGIIRASNTSDYLTARFDADSAENLQVIRTTFSRLLIPTDERLARLLLE